jgi:hypothetical protein
VHPVPSTPKSRSGTRPKTPSDSGRDDQQKRKAGAACDSILERFPTIFGKLVTLAGLQILGEGQYNHPHLDGTFPSPVVNAVLQQRHEDAFKQWLSLSLEEQHKQLTEFFYALWTVGKPRLPQPVRNALAPVTAGQAERILFLSDLACTISVIESGH